MQIHFSPVYQSKSKNKMTLEVKFIQEEIIPDVIDKSPTFPLQITFDDNEVNFGKELSPTQVKNIPKVTFQFDQNIYYTLIFTDPDAPSRANPIRREFLHWLVGNIKGNTENGKVLAEFLSSAPGKDSGIHRYTFLLFKQKEKIQFDEKVIPDTTREGRRHFSTKGFAKKYNLELVAGNFYLAQWDEYVEEVNKKLEGT